ncbi:alcohol dehydrogenase-like regulatory protein ErcA [Methanothermobacter sp. THM-2]|uniref:alcohol dehydrogenase-like regulatory protein ErcA n=1 Tax=Methanothermobacter sp. THM-2 TaxID=2606912 RepID=UPI0013660970|nr:alcohol dehydrogenase-like regulatory protein ErcA [Methanothermobacter sp. THM-2]QHN07995.1 iron-containing alcohol dehydrogenase [Methanothermobacter sp. THM-2]
MGELRKFVTPEFVFGNGARFLAGRYASNLGASRVLLVTDHGIMKTGLVDDVTGSLHDEGLDYVIFNDVTPNPRDHEVMEGAEVFDAEECNMIVALGGGSPIDCAKAMGAVVSNRMNVLEFEGVDRIPVPSIPIICIPTTAGTGADVSQFAIIMDTHRRVKMAIISKAMVPDASLIDPETTLTMDGELTAATGMDALAHAIEAYVSNASFHLTDLNALDSIGIINRALPGAVLEPDNMDYREDMMLASLEAGLAFSNASLGLVHAMAHSLGGKLDIPHGEANALLLEYVIEFNFKAAGERYLRIAGAMGLEGSGLDELKAYIREFQETLGMDMTLGDLGVDEEDIPALAETSMRDPCIVTNPVRPEQGDVEEIFRRALSGP